MTIGETASSSIRLSACEGIDITMLEDGKERRLYTENCGKQQKIDKGKRTKKGFIL